MKDRLTQIKKWLYTFSGDDFTIIRNCEQGRQSRFAAIGVFVLLILSMCFMGSFVTFYKVFDSISIGLFISFFFSFVIINIYLLMIYTLTRNTLPHRSSRGNKVISIMIRCAFVAFIAVVVSKPVETLLYKTILDKEISEYKNALILEYTHKTDQFYKQELQRQSAEMALMKNLDVATEDDISLNRKKSIQKLERDELIYKMERLVQRSNFYIQSLKLLSRKHPTSWLVTALSILIFLSPIILKSLVSSEADYYVKKREKDYDLVVKEYAKFKTDFTSIIKARYSKEKTYCEVYADPPFNTMHLTDPRNFEEEKLLIQEIYND